MNWKEIAKGLGGYGVVGFLCALPLTEWIMKDAVGSGARNGYLALLVLFTLLLGFGLKGLSKTVQRLRRTDAGVEPQERSD